MTPDERLERLELMVAVVLKVLAKDARTQRYCPCCDKPRYDCVGEPPCTCWFARLPHRELVVPTLEELRCP